MYGESVSFEDSHLEQIIELRQYGKLISDDGTEKLYLPLIGSNNSMIGLIALDINEDQPIKELEMQILVILSTPIAISLENTKFFMLSMFDGLTGLYVRREFDARLSEEMARIYRYGGDLGLLLVDIDHFKSVNDNYGHQQGDLVLTELAEVFLETVRNNVDIACRYGGEEFIAILPSTNIEGSTIAANRFRQSCEAYSFSEQEKPLKITVSCGVAAINRESRITSTEFIRRTDEMLYQAKKMGRNQVQVWK